MVEEGDPISTEIYGSERARIDLHVQQNARGIAQCNR